MCVEWVWLVVFSFSLTTLNILSHSLLAGKVIVKSADSLMRILLYVTSCLSLAALKVLSLSLTFENLIIMSMYESL